MEIVLHYGAIYYLVNVLIQGGALVVILSVRQKPRYLWWLAGYFFFFLWNSIDWLGLNGLVHPNGAYFYYVGIVFNIGLASYVMFIHDVVRLPGQDIERRVAAVTGFGIAAASAAYVVWQTIPQRPVLLPARDTFGFPSGTALQMAGLVCIVIVGYALLLLFRKWWILKRERRTKEAGLMARLTAIALLMMAAYGGFWFTVKGWVDYREYQVAHSFVGNLIVLFDVLIILGWTPQSTSFQVRIVGIAFVTTLSVVVIIARLAFMDRQEASERETAVSAELAVSGGPIVIGNTAFDYVMVLAEGKPRVIFQRQTDLRLPDIVALFPENTLQTRCADHHVAASCYKSYRFVRDGRTYEVGEQLKPYLLRVVHPHVLHFVFIVLGTAGAMLIIYPFFFRGNLIRPVQEVLRGVARLKAADYSTPVPVFHKDEIGALAESFNEMTRAIEKYQIEIIDSSRQREQALAEVHESRQLALESLAEKRRLELALLKRSIQPHFLMNSLNTMLGLIREDPEAARKLIGALSTEIRIILDLADQPVVPLREEVALCRAHLELMGLRLGRKFSLKTHGLSGEETVPPLIFLTLVENGLSHLEEEARELTFALEKAERERGFLSYTFRAPGSSVRANDREGTGTRYIKGRLENAFPGRWKFSASPNAGEFLTTISISRADGTG